MRQRMWNFSAMGANCWSKSARSNAKSLNSHSTRIKNNPDSLSWCWSAWRIFALWLYRKLAIVATNPFVSGQSINNTALGIDSHVTLLELGEVVNITGHERILHVNRAPTG